MEYLRRNEPQRISACTGVQQGYFNNQKFLNWLINMLLPEITVIYGGRPMVIILDNNFVHIDQQVVEAVQGASHCQPGRYHE